MWWAQELLVAREVFSCRPPITGLPAEINRPACLGRWQPSSQVTGGACTIRESPRDPGEVGSFSLPRPAE